MSAQVHFPERRHLQVTPEDEIEALIARLPLGDRAAFGRLYDLTGAKLHGVCLRVLKDGTAAEDAVQETYVKVWNAAGRFAPGAGSAMGWLVTIARNTAIDRLRARRRGEVGTEAAEALPAPGATPEAVAEARSEAARIVLCLDELDPGHRAAVVGVYLDGLSYADLAERRGMPLNTVRTWLRRSLQRLKECMAR
ncbi:sigma-70 family RNA polymerase sigma factor [Histidinibacterium lentulum]|uniref:sigma-70 family RNA polymerase sigma factor n=1 Tax=Histidinibacterium lentulum TaxID=2480588 RepID=UPI001FE3568E|nr:sigma-70 family RNA polymerase sigma factor [Histidinibacterium lentulum]